MFTEDLSTESEHNFTALFIKSSLHTESIGHISMLSNIDVSYVKRCRRIMSACHKHVRASTTKGYKPFVYLCGREKKQKVGEEALMQEPPLHTLLGSESK